ADLNENDPDSSGAALNYTVTAAEHGKVLVDGKAATSFSQLQLEHGQVSFPQDGSAASEASFAGSLSDKSGLTATATVNGDVAVSDHAPVFKSPADVDIDENKTSVEKVKATDPDHDTFVFSIAGGDDKGFFTINPNNGELKFLNAPDFETPKDGDHNNVYKVVVAATDSHGAMSQQAIDVNVTDVHERNKSANGPHSNDGNDAFVFNGSLTATNAGNQGTTAFDHDLFARVQEVVEAAHTIIDGIHSAADVGHGPTPDESMHPANAHHD